MRFPDYHIHTLYSPDSQMEPDEAVRAAIGSGITDICFTEHMDLGHHMEAFNHIPDFERIEKVISQLRKKYSECNINIGKGIEVGYISHTAKQTAKILTEQNFDYILLSTHCVDGIDYYLPEYKRNQDKFTAYKRYLKTVYDSVMDGNLAEHYDCVSHIGYIAKCNHYDDNSFPYQLFPQLVDRILCEIIKQEKGIEVNTSGINRAGHVLPHPGIIRRYRELGGRIITIGSDAHNSQNVGIYIKDAINIISKSGFEEITLFKKREPSFIKIPPSL